MRTVSRNQFTRFSRYEGEGASNPQARVPVLPLAPGHRDRCNLIPKLQVRWPRVGWFSLAFENIKLTGVTKGLADWPPNSSLFALPIFSFVSFIGLFGSSGRWFLKEGTWLAIAVWQIASKSSNIKHASLGRRFEKNLSWQLSFAVSLLWSPQGSCGWTG